MIKLQANSITLDGEDKVSAKKDRNGEKREL